MRCPLKVPGVGAGDEPIRLSGWLVDQGDFVLAGDIIAEILIPGVSMDVMSEASGWLVEIVSHVDGFVREGDVLGWLEVGETEGFPET